MLRIPLCDQLGIRLPIIQAPMAGGVTTPELVAAVSDAGALGSFGFTYTQPESMQRDAEAVRARAKAPFNLNLFVAPRPGAVDPAEQRGAMEALARYYAEVGLPPPQAVCPPFAPDLDTHLHLVEEISPPVFTFHLGEISAERIRRLPARGTKVGATAICLAEASHLESLGVDFILAQGAEAGAIAARSGATHTKR